MWVRRVTLAPLAFVLSLLLLVVSPVLLLVAAVADVFLPGNWRTVRVVAFGIGYLVLEVAGLVALFGLWVRYGFGIRIRSDQSVESHHRFTRWWLRSLSRVSRRTFGLRVHIEDRPDPRPGPVLVFSRHAGPGNSLLLVGTLAVGYERRPRIVMLAKLQWEPLFDIMLNRTPNRFITHDKKKRDAHLEAIGDLAGGLGDEDAFVLFPEGKDFKLKLRDRAIESLRSKGYETEAERAARMAHTLPPRHNGVAAAIAAAPQADVVFVAHSVLEDVGSFRELWGRVPLTKPVVGRYWRLAPTEVPAGEQERIDWLYDWWERIDRWIDERTAAAHADDTARDG